MNISKRHTLNPFIKSGTVDGDSTEETSSPSTPFTPIDDLVTFKAQVCNVGNAKIISVKTVNCLINRIMSY